MKKFTKSLATVAVLAVVTLGASACADDQARQQAATALQVAQDAKAAAQQAAASAAASAAAAQAAADKVERIFNRSLRK